MKQNKDQPFDPVEEERLRSFMSLSAKQKLEHLEKLNHFLRTAMPESSKKAWEKLRQEGF